MVASYTSATQSVWIKMDEQQTNRRGIGQQPVQHSLGAQPFYSQVLL